MRAVIAVLCSLVIPGLGHLFYGEFLWAAVWFILAVMSCGLANILSAIHCIYISSK